jgi:hypothetical protein
MEREGLEPEFVFYAVLPLVPNPNGPTDQPSHRRLYTSLTEDTSIPNQRLKDYKDTGGGDGPGLWISDIILPFSQQLFDQEVTSITNDPNIHYIEQNGLIWVASVISGTQEPQYLNQNWQQSLDSIRTEDPKAHHAGLSQILALQALKAQAGEPAIDNDTWTFTEQTFTDSDGKACVVSVRWIPAFGQVSVDSDGVGVSDESLGGRRSVMGSNST